MRAALRDDGSSSSANAKGLRFVDKDDQKAMELASTLVTDSFVFIKRRDAQPIHEDVPLPGGGGDDAAVQEALFPGETVDAKGGGAEPEEKKKKEEDTDLPEEIREKFQTAREQAEDGQKLLAEMKALAPPEKPKLEDPELDHYVTIMAVDGQVVVSHGSRYERTHLQNNDLEELSRGLSYQFQTALQQIDPPDGDAAMATFACLMSDLCSQECMTKKMLMNATVEALNKLNSDTLRIRVQNVPPPAPSERQTNTAAWHVHVAQAVAATPGARVAMNTFGSFMAAGNTVVVNGLTFTHHGVRFENMAERGAIRRVLDAPQLDGDDDDEGFDEDADSQFDSSSHWSD